MLQKQSVRTKGFLKNYKQQININQKQTESSKLYFKISILNPINNLTLDFKYFDDKVKSETLMNIMNNLCFGDNLMDKIDGNFISIYDDKDKRFHYYVHRLLGFLNFYLKKVLFFNLRRCRS